MPHRAPSLLACVAVLAACAADRPPDRAAAGADDTLIGQVEILEPADGAVLGSDVHVALNAVGVQVEPAGGTRVPGHGHLHLFIDHDLSPAGQPIPAGVPGIVHKGDGSAEHTISSLAPGEHRLIAVLGYGDHVPVERVATDTVTFVVRAP